MLVGAVRYIRSLDADRNALQWFRSINFVYWYGCNSVIINLISRIRKCKHIHTYTHTYIHIQVVAGIRQRMFAIHTVVVLAIMVIIVVIVLASVKNVSVAQVARQKDLF